MNEDEKQAIKELLPFIKGNTRALKEVTAELWSKGSLTEEEWEEINSSVKPLAQCSLLYTALMRRPAWGNLLKTLRKTGNSHIFKRLQRKKVMIQQERIRSSSWAFSPPETKAGIPTDQYADCGLLTRLPDPNDARSENEGSMEALTGKVPSSSSATTPYTPTLQVGMASKEDTDRLPTSFLIFPQRWFEGKETKTVTGGNLSTYTSPSKKHTDCLVNIDGLSETTYEFSYKVKDPWKDFIRKFYWTLTMNLCITFCFTAFFLFCEPVTQWVKETPIFVYAVCIFQIVPWCVQKYGMPKKNKPLKFTKYMPNMREPPATYICLFSFACVDGVFLGAVYSFNEITGGILAVGTKIFVCLAITILFALPTKINFAKHLIYFIVVAIVLILFCFFINFLRIYFPVMQIVYSCVSGLLYSFNLVSTTESIISNSRADGINISPDEYIFAALSFSLDISRRAEKIYRVAT